MFRAQSARNPLIIRRSTQIVHMQPLVSSLSASDRLVQDGHLQRVTISEAAYVQFASLTPDDERIALETCRGI
jgi:hypothetical protein